MIFYDFHSRYFFFRFHAQGQAGLDAYVVMSVTRAQSAFTQLFKDGWLAGATIKPVRQCLDEALDNADVWLSRDSDFISVAHSLITAFSFAYVQALCASKLDMSDQRHKLEYVTRIGDDRLELLNAIVTYNQGGVSQEVMLNELNKLSLVQDVIDTDPELLSVFFSRLSDAFPTNAPAVLSGLLALLKVGKSQVKELLEEFAISADVPMFARSHLIENVSRVHTLVNKKLLPPPLAEDANVQKKSRWAIFRSSGGAAKAAEPVVSAKEVEKVMKEIRKVNAKEEALSLDDFLD
jgi:hypothetical protein